MMTAIYSDEIRAEIVRRLAEGEALREICRTDGYPTESTVRMWAMDDKPAGFNAQYTRARDIGLDKEADDIRLIADDLSDDPKSRAVRIDARKWRLSKMAPKRYGDSMSVDHNVKGGLDIRVTRVDTK